jgi:hypothetical protein
MDDAGAAYMAMLPAINDSAYADLWFNRSLSFTRTWVAPNVTIAPRFVNESFLMTKLLWEPYPKNV